MVLLFALGLIAIYLGFAPDPNRDAATRYMARAFLVAMAFIVGYLASVYFHIWG